MAIQHDNANPNNVQITEVHDDAIRQIAAVVHQFKWPKASHWAITMIALKSEQIRGNDIANFKENDTLDYAFEMYENTWLAMRELDGFSKLVWDLNLMSPNQIDDIIYQPAQKLTAYLGYCQGCGWGLEVHEQGVYFHEGMIHVEPTCPNTDCRYLTHSIENARKSMMQISFVN